MIKRVRPSTNKLEVVSQMDASSYLRSGEEGWQGMFENLSQRFAELDPSTIADTLRQNDGHAGRTAQALRKLPKEAAKTEPKAPTPAITKPDPEVKTTVDRPASDKSSNRQSAVQEDSQRSLKTPIDSKLLFIAALQGDVQELTRLIVEGADLNGRYTGRPNREQKDKIIEATPLHFVVTMGMANIAEALLRHGADVEARMERSLGPGKPPAEHYAEMTPLHLAAMEGHTNIVEMLLDCGADRHAIMYLKEQQGDHPQERTFSALEIAEEMATKGHMRESVISLLSAPI
jgi:hypothetical protein